MDEQCERVDEVCDLDAKRCVPLAMSGGTTPPSGGTMNTSMMTGGATPPTGGSSGSSSTPNAPNGTDASNFGGAQEGSSPFTPVDTPEGGTDASEDGAACTTLSVGGERFNFDLVFLLMMVMLGLYRYSCVQLGQSKGAKVPDRTRDV